MFVWLEKLIDRFKPLEYKDYENCFRFIGDENFRKECMKNIKGELPCPKKKKPV